MAAKKQSASFEESLARLDEIVKHLEKGDMPLSFATMTHSKPQELPPFQMTADLLRTLSLCVRLSKRLTRTVLS